MKRIYFLLALALTTSGAEKATAQVVPQVSDTENTYEYYIQNAGQNSGYYLNTNVGANNHCVSFGNTGTHLKVKLVATATEGRYNIIPTNVEGYNCIGCTGTGNGAVVTYYNSIEEASNATWSLNMFDTNGSYNGYNPAYSICISGTSRGINMYQGTSKTVAALWDNNDQGSAWNFMPANAAALEIFKNQPQTIGHYNTEDIDINTTDFPTWIASKKGGHIILPTGYYYIKNMNTASNQSTFGAYVFTDLWHSFGQSNDVTLANVPDTKDNRYIWHITNDGTANVEAISGEGGYFNMGSDIKRPTIGTTPYYTNGYIYFTQGIHFTNQAHHTLGNTANADAAATKGNPFKATSWAHALSAGSTFTFEPLIDAEIEKLYTVSISGDEGKGYLMCSTGEKAKNGGFIVIEDISAITLTGAPVEGFTSSVAINDKTIALTYTLTDEEAQKRLMAVIQDTQNNYLGLSGVGYPSETSTARTSLESTVTTLEAQCNAATLTAADYPTALATLTEKLNAYKATPDIEMPVSGEAYFIKHIKYDGSYEYVWENEGELRAHTADPSTTAVFIYVETGEGKGVFVNAATGKYLSYKTMQTDYTPSIAQITLTSANNITIGSLITKTPPFGSFRLDVVGRSAAESNYPSSLIFSTEGLPDDCSATFFFQTGHSNIFQIEKAVTKARTDYYTANKPTLRSKEAKAYATLYLPYAVTLPADIAAYYAAATENGKVTMTPIGNDEARIIPKNTGVVLITEVAEAGKRTLNPALSTGTAVTTNRLTGIVNEGEELTVEDGYTLCALSGEGNRSIGFYLFNGTPKPGTAYLSVPTDMLGSANGLMFNFDNISTGIGSITTPTNKSTCVYDLSGRRVENPTQGLYIVDGKKVFIK